MNYLYSAKDNKFYPYSLQSIYQLSGVWPDKGVDIGEDEFKGLINPPEGMVVASDDNGMPVLVNIPPLTKEQLIARFEEQKNVLLENARRIISIWQTKLMLSRISEDELKSLNEWLDYIEALSAIDTNSASDIVWPTSPDLS